MMVYRVTVSGVFIRIAKVIFGWVPTLGLINTIVIRLGNTAVAKNSPGQSVVIF